MRHNLVLGWSPRTVLAAGTAALPTALALAAGTAALPIAFALAAGTAALPTAFALAAGTAALPITRELVDVSGRIRLVDRDDRGADDVAQAVVWLEGESASPVRPIEVEITTVEKFFSPHVVVVSAGSTISFPNHDPFNHNVFSQSEENQFDLGLYGRGESRSAKFSQAGAVRIYCNVHAQMSAVVVVRDNAHFTQPSTDGSFSLAAVPPGNYVAHAWHERAEEGTKTEIRVPSEGLRGLELELDARGYTFKPHLNKHGRPYAQQGRRY